MRCDWLAISVSISVILACILGQASGAEIPELSIEKIEAHLAERTARIGGYVAELKHSGFMGHEATGKPMWEWQLKISGRGRSIRAEVTRLSGKNADSNFFNAYCWIESQGIGSSIGEIRNVPASSRFGGVIYNRLGAGFGMLHWTTPIEYYVLDEREPLERVLTMYKWHPPQYQNGLSKHGPVVFLDEVDSGPPDSLWSRSQVWLAPGRDWMPVRIRTVTRGPNGYSAYTDYSVEEAVHDGRIWLPKRAVVLFHHPLTEQQRAAGDKEIPDTMCLFEFSRYETGLQINDEQLVVRFPVGTSVFDDITKESFIAGKAIFVKETDGLVYLERMAADDPLQSWTDFSRGLTDAEWDNWSASLPWLDLHKRPASQINPPGAPAPARMGMSVRNVIWTALAIVAVVVGIAIVVRQVRKVDPSP